MMNKGGNIQSTIGKKGDVSRGERRNYNVGMIGNTERSQSAL
jgi:hypothetical protein